MHILRPWRLVTAQIFYHLPDYPNILQEYIRQEYDLPPRFPELRAFLDFWQRNLDGKIHSVYVASKEILGPPTSRYSNFIGTLQ